MIEALCSNLLERDAFSGWLLVLVLFAFLVPLRAFGSKERPKSWTWSTRTCAPGIVPGTTATLFNAKKTAVEHS